MLFRSVDVAAVIVIVPFSLVCCALSCSLWSLAINGQLMCDRWEYDGRAMWRLRVWVAMLLAFVRYAAGGVVWSMWLATGIATVDVVVDVAVDRVRVVVQVGILVESTFGWQVVGTRDG